MEYDDVIVGAGSTGAVLAARLSEDSKRSILLLEAGPDYRTIKETPHDLLRASASFTGHDWGWSAQVTPQREIPFTRGKVVGGCSAVNATVALRGIPADFDEWAAVGNDEWSFEKVLPFYRKLEHDADFTGDLHGKSGPLWIERSRPANWHPIEDAFYASCRRMGFPDSPDFNSPDSTGVGPCARNLRDGIRLSTAIAYLEPARHRLNLTIRGGCTVSRVLIRNDRAIGVEVESKGKMQQVYGRRVTLSAGAFASPAILLRSGIGPCHELERHSIEPLAIIPGVGANLLDHPLIALLAELNDEAEPGSRNEYGGASVLLRYTASESEEFNDMQTYMIGVTDWGMFPGFPVEPGSAAMALLMIGLEHPHSRGRLRLCSADHHAQPDIALNFLNDPQDMQRMINGVRLAWRIMHESSMAHRWRGPLIGGAAELLEDRIVNSDEMLAAFIRNNCGTFWHPAGTARMGLADDDGAVVDQYCRVRGIKGLRIADASIMPSIVRANTNLTCIMIGERVAEWMNSED